MISAWTVHSPALWVWHLRLVVRGARGVVMAGHMLRRPYFAMGLWHGGRWREMYWAPGAAKHERGSTDG